MVDFRLLTLLSCADGRAHINAYCTYSRHHPPAETKQPIYDFSSYVFRVHILTSRFSLAACLTKPHQVCKNEFQCRLKAICTSPDKTDTEIWLTNAVCYRSECCTAFKVASRHKRQLPTRYPPFIPFALLNYVTHSEKE